MYRCASLRSALRQSRCKTTENEEALSFPSPSRNGPLSVVLQGQIGQRKRGLDETHPIGLPCMRRNFRRRAGLRRPPGRSLYPLWPALPDSPGDAGRGDDSGCARLVDAARRKSARDKSQEDREISHTKIRRSFDDQSATRRTATGAAEASP